MRFRIKHLTVGCREPRRLAQWWASLLGGWHIDHDGGSYVVISSRTDPGWALGFVREEEAPEGAGAHRWHLDLALEGEWEEAVARARDLGARETARHHAYGQEWIVFADPEGNLFCV